VTQVEALLGDAVKLLRDEFLALVHLTGSVRLGHFIEHG
jgi:hypothetical protein